MGRGNLVRAVRLLDDDAGPVVVVDERAGRYWAYFRDPEGIGIGATPAAAMRLLANHLRALADAIDDNADE